MHGMIDQSYRLIWRLLQLVVSIYATLRMLAFELQSVMPWSYDFWRRGTVITRRDRAFLERCKEELTKLPRHINIILGTADWCRNDVEVVSRIAAYALIMGVEYVSFYDPIGGIDVDTLRVPNLKEMRIEILNKRHLLWEWHGPSTDSHYTLLPGVTSSEWHKRLEILKILPYDNRAIIENISRELFAKRQSIEVQALLKDRTHFMQYLDEQIKLQTGIAHPDPDLSIVFEEHTCTYGMLPWQTRFTEFHKFERGERVNPNTFVNILCRYSRCEQRWGK